MIIHQNPFIAFIDRIIPNSIIEDMNAIPNDDFSRSFGMSPEGVSISTNIRTSSTYHTRNKFKSATEIVLNFLAQEFIHVYDINKAERWQLTQYEPTQFYKPHYDYFHNSAQLNGKTNRIATAILYLNDNFTGGETKFPKLEISITPRLGALLYFTYPINNPNNNLTFHSGEPVINGIKRIATLWLR
jgi:prolyl 4-hydroxylase